MNQYINSLFKWSSCRGFKRKMNKIWIILTTFMEISSYLYCDLHAFWNMKVCHSYPQAVHSSALLLSQNKVIQWVITCWQNVSFPFLGFKAMLKYIANFHCCSEVALFVKSACSFAHGFPLSSCLALGSCHLDKHKMPQMINTAHGSLQTKLRA